MSVIILGSHPYWRFCQPTIRPCGDVWRVKWRDFLTYKQDSDFPTLEAAAEFAKSLVKPPLVFDEENYEVDWQELAESDRWWKAMANA